jgi:hypothetical protein
VSDHVHTGYEKNCVTKFYTSVIREPLEDSENRTAVTCFVLYKLFKNYGEKNITGKR